VKTTAHGPGSDAAPQELAGGTPTALADDLRRLIAADRVLTRPIDLIRYASDASLYRLIPRAVVLAADATEVSALFAYTRSRRIPMTFRSAGTSLSGQSQTDGILVEVRRHFDWFEILEDGAAVRAGPGVIAGKVNAALVRHGRKLGPDPASVNAATIGGIVANNSSGMCCGITDNAYQTMRSIEFVLPSGTRIDTAAPGAEATFAASEPALAAALTGLRRRLLDDPDLTATLRRKYAIKNTTGYGLNALLDHETPLGMFSHLLVGSEGTLGFIAQVVLETVPDLRHRSTALAMFPTMRDACAAVAAFRDAGAAAVELLDRASLRSVADRPGVPAGLADLPAGTAALLVEMRTASAAELAVATAAAETAAAGMPVVGGLVFTTDAVRQREYWAVREGLFTSVGAARPTNTSVVLEDVTFPPARLAEGVAALAALFAAHGYPDAVVFGHAKEGNLHFLLTPRFDDPAEIDRYAGFMRAMVDLVAVGFGGSLKGEHGTGRNMAPFVLTEWGPVATGMMRIIKQAADPDGMLNPGVVLSDDPDSFLDHLKSAPTIKVEADRCIECGYCERVCPSRDLTTTPRQRIVIRREMVRQLAIGTPGSTAMADALARDIDYDVRDTCAGDGLCEMACPVDIDTGALVKRLRATDHPPAEHRLANAAAGHWATAERLTRTALLAASTAARVGSPAAVAGATAAVRRLTGDLLVPNWTPATPSAAPALPATAAADAVAVYFPACVNRMFGPPAGELSTPAALVALAARAGRPVWIPPDVAGACCTTPWVSKGYPAGAATMAAITLDRAWAWTDHGRLPLVTDASSCASGLTDLGPLIDDIRRQRFAAITVLDSIDFVHDTVLPGLLERGGWHRSDDAIVVHATCSVQHAHNVDRLLGIVGAVTTTVLTPGAGSCCGFAGDRGFWRPELTASATAELARDLRDYEVAHGPVVDRVSSNRPCEIGLSDGTGSVFGSYLRLLEERTRPNDKDDV
jgi:D-lactate dehydrogenase